MKRKSILLFLCGVLSTSVFAHGIGAVPAVKDARWTAVQIGVWPFLLFDDGAKVMTFTINTELNAEGISFFADGKLHISVKKYNLSEA